MYKIWYDYRLRAFLGAVIVGFCDNLVYDVCDSISTYTLISALFISSVLTICTKSVLCNASGLDCNISDHCALFFMSSNCTLISIDHVLIDHDMMVVSRVFFLVLVSVTQIDHCIVCVLVSNDSDSLCRVVFS